jgi:hypothetical protein
LDRFDFFEPRVYGRYLYVPKSVTAYGAFVTNQNKSFTYEVESAITKFDQDQRITYLLNGGVKYRFNTRFSLAFDFQYTHKVNDLGWVAFDDADIIFGSRDREILQNNITGKYAINTKMTLNLTGRYYWSYSDNKAFFTLQDDGYLTPNNDYSLNKNRNFNSWNFDLSYSWWFAPGSELSVLYRNYAQMGSNTVERNFSSNLKDVFNADMTNILSFSLRYFIDYNRVKNKF